MPTVGVFAAIFDDQGRILSVRQAAGARRWALPGGRMEAGETPDEALIREVLEETGFAVTIGDLIGLYSTPAKDALAISFRARVVDRTQWRPTEEIAEFGFFARDALPSPMRPHILTRVQDAFNHEFGAMRNGGILKAEFRKLGRVS